MARFVMANRRAGKFRENDKVAARAAVDRSMATISANVNIVNDLEPEDPTARRVVVFDADPGDVRSVPFDPDVMVEPEILHWPGSVAPADFIFAERSRLAGAVVPPGSATVEVRVKGGRRQLKGATVILFLRGPGGLSRQLEQVTPANGNVTFSFASSFQPSALVVEPPGGFWSVVVRGPASPVDVVCPALPEDGPLAWWHKIFGIKNATLNRGAGIKVGVADTGVGPHACLQHVVRAGAFIDGAALPPPQTADADSHGSHVCGIIGARPVKAGQYMGIAPGVDLFCARVFPPGQGANQGDIANAIDALSRAHQVDLLNLSLGAPQKSNIELDAIRDALERGTLCICAAANSAGPVEFPAAFDECIAVTALGVLGWGPAGSLAAGRLPQSSKRFGTDQLYLANFSCFGAEVDCTGPGVGIISTVPERFGLTAPYASMDGTSMASPAACGALAAILAGRSDYTSLPRDESRSQMARRILRETCRDIGLTADLQGRGLPVVPEPGRNVRNR